MFVPTNAVTQSPTCYRSLRSRSSNHLFPGCAAFACRNSGGASKLGDVQCPGQDCPAPLDAVRDLVVILDPERVTNNPGNSELTFRRDQLSVAASPRALDVGSVNGRMTRSLVRDGSVEFAALTVPPARQRRRRGQALTMALAAFSQRLVGARPGIRPR